MDIIKIAPLLISFLTFRPFLCDDKFYVNIKIDEDWRRLAEYENLIEKGPSRFRVELAKIDENGDGTEERLTMPKSQETEPYDVTAFRLPDEWVQQMLPGDDEKVINIFHQQKRMMKSKSENAAHFSTNNLFELKVGVNGGERRPIANERFRLVHRHNMVIYSIRTGSLRVEPYDILQVLRPHRKLAFRIDSKISAASVDLASIECFPVEMNGWIGAFNRDRVAILEKDTHRVCPLDLYHLHYTLPKNVLAKIDPYKLECDEAIYESPKTNVYIIRRKGKGLKFSCKLDKNASNLWPEQGKEPSNRPTKAEIRPKKAGIHVGGD